jgi:hypothetical protein
VAEIPGVAGIPHQAAEMAGSHRPEAEEADSHRPEAEEEADSHRVEAVDTHRVEAVDTHRVEAGSYQVAVAVDQSWTPSSDEISWQRAC